MIKLKRFAEVFAKVVGVLLVVLAGAVGYFYWQSGSRDLAGWLDFAKPYLVLIPVVGAVGGLTALFEAGPKKAGRSDKSR